MYLLYENYYGDLILDCGESSNIIGLYDNREKAIKKAKDLIEKSIKENNYVLDKERNNLEEDNYIILFWNNQENWNCYYEMIIKKVDIE